MAVTVVTSNNNISSAAAALAATITDCTGRVSSNVNCLVAILHSSITAQSARWDVCGANTTMTTAGEITGATGRTNNIKAFYLMNPGTGEHIVRVATSGSAEAGTGTTAVGRTLGVYALASVADVGTIGSFVALTGNADDLSAQVASTANEIVIDACHFDNTTDVSANAVLSAGTNQTEAYDRRPGGNTVHEMAGSFQVGETSTRMSWGENFGTLCNWTHCAFNVVATALPAAGGGTFKNMGLARMGAGG